MNTHTRSWVSMHRILPRLIAAVVCAVLVFGAFVSIASAATGVPRIMNYQGRLMSSGGALLGGSSGTDYCVKFSIYDNPTVGSGTKLWPSSSPSTMTVNVKTGIFNAGVGDTNAGGDTLNFDFESNDAVYLNVEVAAKVGATCAPGDGAESFENLSPRQRVSASGYAINSATLGGQTGAFYRANSYSTTSAAYDLSTYSKGYFFSTTSVNYWSASMGAWATTSSDAWLATKTTDNLTQGSTNLYYSPTLVNSFIAGSSSIPKTFANNSFTGTNSFAGDVTLANATTSNFNILNTISGAGLVSCSSSSDKLVWNATTRQFGCGADAGAGGGLTALGAEFSTYQTGSSQTLATSSDTNIGITITSSGDTHTFSPSWIGTLSGTRGGTGIGSIAQNGILIGAAGNTWSQVSTSSLGLPTFATLSSYLDFAAWYATTTDALAEGSINKYYTQNRFATSLAGTTTDALAQGSVNKYYNDTLVQDYLDTVAKPYFFATSSAAFNLASYDKGFFFSTTSVNYWESTQYRWATTSTDAWFATKTTSNLPEGTNLYYTPNRVAGVIAGTTTDALAEGSFNQYFTPNRVAGVIAGTTTDALAEGSTNKYFNNTNADAYLNAKDKGYFFSTTSASVFSANGLSFSTTSTDFWKSVNNFFSTTSASHFSSLGLAFSTTSASYFLGQNLGTAFSTSSTDYYMQASTTVPKTYSDNTFTGTNDFQNVTAANATTTSSFTGTASSSNLYSNIATIGSVIAGVFTGNTVTATNATTTTLYAGTASSTNAYANTASIGTASIGSASVNSLSLTNALTAANGGTGLNTVTQHGLLIGGPANSWTQVSTSSLGLVAFSDLGAYMGLAQWYATTTDALAEGTNNKYFTPNRVASVLASTTTDAIAEGSVNQYFTPNRVAGVIAGTTTDALAEGTTNKYFNNTNADSYLNAKDKGYFFSTTSALYFNSQNDSSFSTTSADFWKTQNNFHSTTSFAFNLGTYDKGYFFSTTSVNYWESSQYRWATTSTDAWFATKSTSDLPEGTNLYYTPNRVAGVIAGTTTDALAEGSVNQYFTPGRVNSFIAGSSSIPKTFSDNAFTGTNSFNNITAAGATTTSLSTGIASTTDLTVSRVSNGLLGTGANGVVQATTFSGPLSYNGGILTLTQSGAAQNGYVSSTDWNSFNSRLSTSTLALVDKGFFFSTTSASNFAAAGLAFSTTSAAYFNSQNAGASFSTTSTDYWKTQNNFFSTTSASVFSANGLAFSTTSTDYWRSVNNFFSTTSASHFSSLGLSFSTTSAAAFLAVNQGQAFSTTSVNHYMESSTTVPTMYKNNTFTGVNSFANITFEQGTSTSFFSNLISSLFGSFGSFTATSSNATSTVAGSLLVGTSSGSYKVSVLGNVTAPTGATGTAVMAVSNDNNTLSSGNNVLRLNMRTAYGTACVTGTTCPRFMEFFAGVPSGSDTGGRGVGSLRLSTAGTGITQTSGSADFAEYMQLSESAAVGDIVSLNSSGEYRKATAGESLIGVVSDNPAFVGNAGLEGQPNAYIVGFAGVIQTSVSTANGSINAGDLIAASDVPGVGVKLSESGYALGQALQSYSGPGVGTITVLVMPKYVDASIALESYGGGASGASGYWDLSTSTNTVSLASSTYSVSIGSSASTSNLVVSNGFTFGKGTGILKSVAGVVSSALVNLASDVTGVLGISNGGTGTSTAPSNGQVLVGNASGGYDLVAASTLVSQNQGNTFSTTSTDYWKTQNNFFSTTSASVFSANGLAFSTTSTDYWRSVNNFFSTTSASHFSSLGLSFSTTSAAAFLALNQGQAFSTTSASNFAAAGLAFSTTSAQYFQSQNDSSFSTTSANYYAQSSTTVPTTYKNNTFTGTNSFQNITAAGATTTSLSTGIASTTNLTVSGVSNGLLGTGANGVVQATTFSGPLAYNGGILTLTQSGAAQNGYVSSTDWNSFNSRLSTSTLALVDKGFFFSTTSSQYFTSVGLGFSTTSSDAHIAASSSVVTTYKNNTFIGVNAFANITVTGATTTSLFSGVASSTNIFASTARFGSLGAFSLTGSVAAAANSITGISVASTTDLWISNIRNGLLSTNGQGNVVASSTPTASSYNATSNTASQLPYASSTAVSALQQISIGAANGTILQGGASGTSTVAGVLNVTGTNSTSTFSGGVSATRFNTTATSTGAQGINLTGGCFAMNGVCTVSSLSATNTSLTVNPNGGAVGISLNLANPNLWTGLQQFGNATTSLLEATQFYARTITATSSNALTLQANAGLTFGSTTAQMLAVTPSTNRITIGTGGANPALLVLDTKNTSGDPTGVDGSMYYNSNVGVFRCYNGGWVTCGGEAASSTGDVQFRNIDGSFTATSNFNWSQVGNGLTLTGSSTTQTLDLFKIASSSGRTMFGINGLGVMALSSTTDPVTPPAGELNIYAKDIAGRMMPKWVGPAGIDTPFQANLGFNKVVLISSAGAALTSLGATLGNVGTLSAGALSTASLKQSVRRTTDTSAAGAGSLASSRSTTALVTRGNASNIGGFFYTARFGLTTMQAGQRGFFGLSDVTTAPTNVDPTTNTTPGKVGMAFNANTGNWKFVWNVTGTAPTVYDLGASMPLNTTDLYELVMYAKPNDTVINYRITNLSTGFQVASTTATTNIPANTTYLTVVEWMTNNAAAAAVAFDLSAVYVESDN